MAGNPAGRSGATATAGWTATFSVSASGSAPLQYQWSKNGAAIAGATAASYITAPLALTDSGAAFTVTVSNAAGAETSPAAMLSVLAPSADVTTFHNDNQRSGLYAAETQLTPASVKASGFGLVHRLAVDGKVDAQPLALAHLVIGGSPHNVIYAATEHDSVYAFDADAGTLLWRVSLLGSGETPSDDRGCSQVAPEIGITATPVIDRNAGEIIVVAMSKDASGAYHQRLHALALTSGAELSSRPIDIAASVPGTGAPATVNGRIVFAPGQYKERSALLLAQGEIYTSWASHCDIENYTGWILAFAESTLKPAAVFNTEPSGANGGGQGEASFWNSNSGPASDAQGNLYAMTANGIFDAVNAAGFPQGNDYGNSILKLAAPAAGTLTVLDYFTMYNSNAESAADVDLGSGGLMLLPDQLDAGGTVRRLAVGAGKDRNIYLIDRDNLGKYSSTGNANAYQVLMSAFPGGLGVYGAPVYYAGTVYYGAAQDVIRAYRLQSARLPAAASSTSSAAFPYPGAPLSVSANGPSGAIVWAVTNDSAQGVLHAYEAATLTELYNSAESGTRDQFGPGSKYTPPTIANGKVAVATQADPSSGGQNYIAVFGVL